MIKKYFLLVLLLASAVCANAQSFEGTVIYKVTTTFSMSDEFVELGVNEEEAQSLFDGLSAPDTIVYLHRTNGDYIARPNGTAATRMIYKQKENKIYSFDDDAAEDADVCMVINVAQTIMQEMPTVTKLDTIVKVNGVDCEIVRITWSEGETDFYYNSSLLQINPKLYEKHLFDGFADFTQISKSLPLQIVKKAGFMNFVITAVHYTEEPIDAKLFVIPKLKPAKNLNKTEFPGAEYMRIVN
ncbi:MAG: DUF4412 domain-containing protein [Bacteroidetes bacterium]|nr:DUF4412 domain-containing protein [Bacteroidota bacterium]